MTGRSKDSCWGGQHLYPSISYPPRYNTNGVRCPCPLHKRPHYSTNVRTGWNGIVPILDRRFWEKVKGCWPLAM